MNVLTIVALAYGYYHCFAIFPLQPMVPNAPFTPEEVPATSLKFRKNCLGRSANFVVFEKCEIVPCMLRPRHVLAKFMLRWWCSHCVYCARRCGPCGVETVPATSSLRPSRLRLVVPTSPSREYNDPATEYA